MQERGRGWYWEGLERAGGGVEEDREDSDSPARGKGKGWRDVSKEATHLHLELYGWKQDAEQEVSAEIIKS